MRLRPSLLVLLVAFAAVFAAVRPTSAHHSRAMFDMGTNVTYRGIVKEYRWQDPHSHIVITVGENAKDPSTVGTWDIEASAINLMRSRGFTPKMYKAGDPIVVVAHPNKEGSRLILLFYVIRPDGTKLYRAANRYPMEKD